MSHSEIITESQQRAVIERLQRALLDVALCETWLAHNAPALVGHQREAEHANNRALALAHVGEVQR